MLRMTASNNSPKRLLPILSLPLPPPSQRLTHNLLPDVFTPTPTSVVALPDSTPSMVRRARPVPQGAGFSFVTPLPLSFPYEFPKEEVEKDQQEEKNNQDETQEQRYERQMDEVEKVMRRYEVQAGELNSPEYPALDKDHLAGYLSPARRAATFPSARLLALSPAALRDALPGLDVGDAFDFIKSTSGEDGPSTYSSGPMAPAPKDDAAKARYQLSDVLAGRVIPGILPSQEPQLDEKAGAGIWVQKESEKWKNESLAQRWKRRKVELDDVKSNNNYASWAGAYAGHQFGSWAGQLGDGRAITLFETLNHSKSPPERWEVQLKGAGRTPYSRFADGLAVLASSVREFLGSEAVAALGIPTSRALAVTSLPDVEVIRERKNIAAITCRLAQSWIRVGSFQLPASRSDWESVRLMGEYVARVLLRFEGLPESQEPDSSRQVWAKKLLMESARRNAKTVAGWQWSGYMNGVLNTDNISILGLTIDYGPFGFMDYFSPDTTPNHSDDAARYAYKMQPSMVLFAMRQLNTSLSPIIGFEEENGRAPNPGELADLEPAKLKELAEFGEATVKADLEELFINETMTEWRRLYRGRLGLNAEEEDEKKVLLDPLLDVLEELDFTNSLRKLIDFPPLLESSLSGSDEAEGIKKAIDAFLPSWYDELRVLEYLKPQKRDQARDWLIKYAERTLRDVKAQGSSAGWGQERSQAMKKTNPSFILRNWIGEEVIERLEQKDDTAFLAKVLDMCLHPFEEYGVQREGKTAEEVAEEARLLEVGEPLARNMPSCSS